MDTKDHYQKIIQEILIKYTSIPFAYGDIQIETIFDKESQRYLVVILGRENGRRVHGCLVHIDIINDKFWIQKDGTEDGIANKLLNYGIPKERIVLGFRSLKMREYTEFAKE